MAHKSPRLERESATVAAMIRIACRAWHGTEDGLCPECEELRLFADARLERCPFGESKPTCANCLVHCYKADMRERIREVMRFAGPRMMRHHPILAFRHILDGFRKPREIPRKKGKRGGNE